MPDQTRAAKQEGTVVHPRGERREGAADDDAFADAFQPLGQFAVSAQPERAVFEADGEEGGGCLERAVLLARNFLIVAVEHLRIRLDQELILPVEDGTEQI